MERWTRRSSVESPWPTAENSCSTSTSRRVTEGRGRFSCGTAAERTSGTFSSRWPAGSPDRECASWFPTGALTMAQTGGTISPLLSPSSGTAHRTWARSIGWCWPGGLSGRAQPWTWCVTQNSSTVGVPPPWSGSRAGSIDRRSLRTNGAPRQLIPRSRFSSCTALQMKSCHRSDRWSRAHDSWKKDGTSRSGRWRPITPARSEPCSTPLGIGASPLRTPGDGTCSQRSPRRLPTLLSRVDAMGARPTAQPCHVASDSRER
jgi:hypothetical protein